MFHDFSNPDFSILEDDKQHWGNQCGNHMAKAGSQATPSNSSAV
jgi:hypothetical protein